MLVPQFTISITYIARDSVQHTDETRLILVLVEDVVHPFVSDEPIATKCIIRVRINDFLESIFLIY